MSTKIRFHDRMLSIFLVVIIVVAILPGSMIQASNMESLDVFTVTVKTEDENLIDSAQIDYSIKLNGGDYASGNVTTVNGIAEITEMASIDFNTDPVEVLLSVSISKVGYETKIISDELIIDKNGNLDVVLLEKEKVEINFIVKDSVTNLSISEAEVSISGYTTVLGTATGGVFCVELYKDEIYSVQVSKKGYNVFAESALNFSVDSDYTIALDTKIVDDTFSFMTASPAAIEYGQTYSNIAVSTLRKGTVVYSVASGDSISVNSSTGEVTTLKSGTATIQAMLAEDNTYQESIATYNITINNAIDSGFGFANPNPSSIKYVKDGTFSNVADGGKGTGDIRYAITEGDAAIIDDVTGILTIVKVGDVTVTATRAADDKYEKITASYKLVIEKANQTGFAFAVSSPEEQLITNGFYSNAASGGESTGAITYEIVSGSKYGKIEDASSPVVTYIKTGGPIVVKATKAGDNNYKAITAQYSFILKKSPQDELVFGTSNPSVIYKPDYIYENTISGGSGMGEISYEIVSGDAAEIDATTGKLTIIKAGEVTVKATKVADDEYEETTASYTLVIEKANQTGFTFAVSAPEDQFITNEFYSNVASGGEGTGAVVYEIVSGSEYGKIEDASSPVVTYIKVGGPIVVKATKEGDSNYKAVTAQYSLTLKKSYQDALVFDMSNPSIIYKPGYIYENVVSGGSGMGEISYEVTSGNAAEIDAVTGKLTILKAGDVTVKATKAADDKYEETTASYTLVIEKANQTRFAFAVSAPEDQFITNESYSNAASGGEGTGTVIYEIVSGSEYGKIEDVSLPVVTYIKVGGPIVIRATKAGDNNYKAVTAQYSLTLKRSPQNVLAFNISNPTITYNPNLTYENGISGGSGTGAISYKITHGDAAKIDVVTGKLTIVKAGEVTVKATKAADDKYEETTAEYALVIEKANQTGFTFAVSSPEDQFITNKSYSNVAAGGESTGAIVYEIISGSEYGKIEDTFSPVVTYVKVGGPIVVKATKMEDDNYKAVTAQYSLTLKRSPQSALVFEFLEPTVTYRPELTYENPISGGSGMGEISYEITAGDAAKIDAVTGKLSIVKAGEVTVKATKAADDKYESESAMYTITIHKAYQTGFSFADGETIAKTWSETENIYANIASGGQSVGGITYSIVGSISEMPFGGSCASFDTETATVTMHGKGTITIQAVKDGDDCYYPIETQYTLTINRAEQSAFDFESSILTHVTYNDNDNKYTLTTIGGSGIGVVTYSIISGDAVTIHADELTVIKAGVVKVKAVKAATNTYEATEATIEITIEKANQEIIFADSTTTSIIYGNEFINTASPVVVTSVPDGKGYAPLTTITYEVVTGNNIAEVDDTGRLTFKNNETGFIKVKATKPGDDCYNETSKAYVLNVSFVSVPPTAYMLSGDKKNESGWYTGDVTIIPAAGYKISYSNDLIGNTWVDKLVVSAEGYNGKMIYLKNSDGISGAITISENDIRIDKTTPSNLKISYSQSVLDSILQTITFGFYKNPVTVTIEAYDEISHIDTFKYAYNTDFANGEYNGTIYTSQIIYSDLDRNAKATFEIPAQYRGNVSFKAIDIAGNDANKNDDKVIIVDDIAPGVTVSYDNNNAVNEKYYYADRKATITIDEANFFEEDLDDGYLIITVGKRLNNETTFTNTDIKPVFVKDDGVYKAVIDFNENADYTFDIKYTDRSGNIYDSYVMDEFTIDKIAPEISIVYDNNSAENTDYYKANRTATVTIVEHNFRASDIAVESFTAVDVQGNFITVNDYQDFLRNSIWTSSGDTHTLKLNFDTDARYNFVIRYSDLAENVQVMEIDEEFCIDKKAPENLFVSYSSSVTDTMIQAVTFGFYKAPVTVTIVADDITSGVDYFTYSYGVQVGASTINVGKGDTVISSADIQYSNDGKNAAAVFEIPVQFRGCVSFTVTDKAGNTSDALNDDKVIIVDDVAPGITVSYDNNQAANLNYFKADRKATITITEANFFAEDLIDKIPGTEEEYLVITVGKRLNEELDYTYTRIKPTFVKNGDMYTAIIEFNENADYTFDIKYTDRSGNCYDSYVMDEFTIDKIAPVMGITYDNNSALNANHYRGNRTATVTIVEHNFRAFDIVVESITAVDIQGNPVILTREYQELLRTGAWNHNGNIHTLSIPFDVDARYDFVIRYSDLANNAQNTEINEKFCIDKDAPAKESLKISYSNSVLNTILQTITFSFYKAPVTVTIEADDRISGIDYLIYSYTVSNNESSTNSGKSKVVVQNDKIDFSLEGKHAKTAFEIPVQFRGNVSFTATDRAGNTSEIFQDETAIIVDNIAPDINVVYNKNDASYSNFYKAPRTATITISEANFFAEAFEKVENIAVNPASFIDEHLVITVTKELNNGTKSTKIFKNADLTTSFKKTAEDKWTASLLFEEDADYSWKIEYKDFSGNIADTFTDSFTVDNINPKINISYDNNSAKNGSYFKDDRTMTIVITEHNFNAEDVVATITSTKETGTITDFAAYLKKSENWISNNDVHTAKILFTTEANYTFDIKYTDKAGRKNDVVEYGKSVAPKAFTLDKTAPTKADIMINNESILATNGIAFEKFYKDSVVIKYSVNCDISGLDNITYQKVDSVAAYSESGVWKAFNSRTGVMVSPSEKFIIYFRAEDKAGNITIVNSIGIIVDDKSPVGEIYAPEIDIKPEAMNENGFHNTDVEVNIKVVDPKYVSKNARNEGYYSGLKKITYKIYTKENPLEVEKGDLLDLDKKKNIGKNGVKFDSDNLAMYWTGKITIDANQFNSNNVIVEITAIDNADNERVTTNEMIDEPVRIDITPPTIDIEYNNNMADSEEFFKADRTAIIKITERNFDAKDVIINVTNTDNIIPTLSNWTRAEGTDNLDNTTWIATITYDADGDYEFSIEYTDLADNRCDEERYAEGTIAAKAFTIDKTIPVIHVSYDNNDARNKNYYKADRTATIVITEHNFNADRVNITMTATDDGKAIALPTVNGWSSNGDKHTATIVYNKDGLYSFDITVTDKVGNDSDDFAKQSFYIDKTAPTLTITGVANLSANNGDIIPVVAYSDTNYDANQVAITLSGAVRKNVALDGRYTNQHNGRIFTFKNFAKKKNMDDIYTLTAALTDKAGNSSTKTIIFSANRFGSTYALSDVTEKMNGSYLQIAENVVVTEVNTNKLKNIKVTLFKNNETITLKKERDYTIDIKSGGNQWYEYTYTVFNKNFEDDGIYRLAFHSEDAAGNVAENTLDTKDKEISFGVDKTKPNVVVTNIENGKTYALENITVIMSANDNLLLNSVDVYLDNYSKVYKSWTAEKIADINANNNEFTFDIFGDSTSAHKVKVVCRDAAGNEQTEEINDFFVTTNVLVRYYNNKKLFFGSIGGVVVIVGFAIFLIAYKKSASKKVVNEKNVNK